MPTIPPTIPTTEALIDDLPPPRALPPTSGAEAIVLRWTKVAASLALVPFPLLDFATTTGCTLKMLHGLAGYYEVAFKPQLVKSSLAALLGGAGAPLLTTAAYSLVRLIPFAGVPLAAVASPVLAGSLTYAVGRVFTAHFGAGGTFLDFDPERFRDYFQAQVETGKAYVGAARAEAKQ